MVINTIELKNFTVFENIRMDFSSGINIFIGENGTGKTHLLKMLYAFCKCSIEADGKKETTDWDKMLEKCFGVDSSEQLRNMNINISDISFDDEDKNFYTTMTKAFEEIGYDTNILPEIAKTKATFFTHNDKHSFNWDLFDPKRMYVVKEMTINKSSKQPLPSVYIPAKDMLTHGGLEKDFLDRNLPFDTTLIDILNKTGVSTKKNIDRSLLRILDKIKYQIGGEVVYKNDKYHIEKDNVGLIDFAVEAEGYKKLGLIYRLIDTGHIRNDGVLFWDEPEANINPKLVPVIVDILLELSRSGVQIFLATHDYFLPQYFDVLAKKSDNIRFHSMYKTNNGVKCETSDKFSTLENNSILDEKIRLYDTKIEKVMQ